MDGSKRFPSSNDLERLYQCSKQINQCREGILFMTTREQERGYVINMTDCRNLDQLRLRMNRLCLLNHDEKIRIYSNGNITRKMPEIPDFPPICLAVQDTSKKPSKQQPKKKSTVILRRTRPPSPPPVLKITKIVFESNQAVVDMTVDSDDNKINDRPDIDRDIVYPNNVADRRPFQTVAKFRQMLGKSTNFIDAPLDLGENKTETAVLGLNSFAERHGCDLMFTNKNHGFDNSMYRAACGTADLGSIHLMATDAVQTATFNFVMDFDFHTEFKQSTSQIEKFVEDFCQSVSTVIDYNKNSVRLFSISKSEKEKKKSEVKFGITSADINVTEQLAQLLKDRAANGFSDDRILARVLPRNYDYVWAPALQTLKICASDLAPEHDYDYRPPFSLTKQTRGGFDYYFPLGWYRYGLRVLDKYENQEWIGQSDSDDVWPVAFHGTKSWAVGNIVDKGLMTSAVKFDAMRSEAIQQKGKEMDRPGLYVATRCDRGASIYTEPFEVTISADKVEKYRIVFQCRVKPGQFTTHTSPVNEGEAWRFVDPRCIRPYGILLKKES